MTPSFPASKWTAAGFLTVALALGFGLQADKASAAPVTPGVSIIATDPSSFAGTSSGAVTLVRYGDPSVSLTVTLDFGGNAVNGTDYTAIANTVTLDPGVLAYDVVVQGLINPANRGNKTVTVAVDTNSGVAIYGRGSATVKITDDLYDVPPPSVTMTSPADGTVFTTPASVTVSATADSELPIQGVSFYAGNYFLGTVTNAPYTLVWSNAPAGKYAIFARAVDQFGKSGVAAPVDITVSSGPVVTLTPPNGQNVFLGEQVQLQATIGDPNEPISSVSFYINNKLFGTVTNAPYTIIWQPPTLGTNYIRAVATDAQTGKKGTSSNNQVIVTPNLGV